MAEAVRRSVDFETEFILTGQLLWVDLFPGLPDYIEFLFCRDTER
jgi:hypothetical protein